jgi:hypothetical protein
MLAWKFHVRMAHPVMPGQSIRAAESLLFGAKIASHLLLAGVVDSVLMTSKVIRSGENSVARLACARVDPITAVGSSLAVQESRCHAHVANRSKILCLAMTLSLVFLKLCRSLES